MTLTTERPAPPRRPFTLIIPVLIAAAGFYVGGLFAATAQGVIWGVIAGTVLVIGFRLGNIDLAPLEQGLVVAGAIAGAVLSTLVFPDLPDDVKPTLALRFGAAWLPMAAATAWVASRHSTGPSTAINIGLTWVVAGVIAIPAAQAFNVLVPINALGPVEEPSFGGSQYAFIGLMVGLIGTAATFAAIEKLPTLIAGAAALLFTAFAGVQVGFSPFEAADAVTKLSDLPNSWPPDFNWALGDGGKSVWWMTQQSAFGFLILGIVALVAVSIYFRSRWAFKITAGVWLMIGIVAFFLWLPSWEFGNPTLDSPIVETFRIAIISATLGTTVALPVAFLASKVTSPSTLVYLLNKGFMNLIRTVPDLFWAMLFVASLGIGPLGGALALFFFSLAIMAKLLSETIDAVDPGPLEAAKSTGSAHLPAIRSGVLPQVLPNYVAYALYIFEINIRASVVLGLVGAGGIGRVLEVQRSFFRFDRVIAIVVVIFVIVLVIEQVSVALRRRLV